MAEDAAPGGFFHSILPSPPLSTAGSDTTPSTLLPRPRATPLKPGSQKQSGLINYVDTRLLHISRRYEKRCSSEHEPSDSRAENSRGYLSFTEMAKDLEAVIDVIWMSGTRTVFRCRSID